MDPELNLVNEWYWKSRTLHRVMYGNKTYLTVRQITEDPLRSIITA